MRQRLPSPHKGELSQTKRQIVAGFIIFRRTYEGVKFLLLYKRGTYWNFPKGHFEFGEWSFDAALREVEEETGLKKSDLRVVPGFRAYERFHFHAGEERVFNTVILYLAESHRVEIKIAPREHSGFGWFLYHDALKTIGGKYHATKHALKRAYDFLQGKSARGRPPHPARHHAHI